MIYWIGPMFYEVDAPQKTAISPAASEWQRNVIEAMEKEGEKIVKCLYVPTPTWPKGCLLCRGQETDEYSISSYLNLKWIRNVTLAWNIFRKIYANKENKKIIVYNPTISLVVILKIGSIFMKQRNVLYAIVADYNDRLLDKLKYSIYAVADGIILLSWELYKNKEGKNKYYFEGIIKDRDKYNNMSANRPKKLKKVLYSGTPTKYGGVEKIYEIARKHAEDDIEYIITGKGHVHHEKNKLTYLGYLNDQEYDKLMQDIDVCVNPRPLDILANEYNFPSKLLFYLSYRKIIVTTRTKGISPEYDNILIYSKSDDPEDIYMAIKEALKEEEKIYKNIEEYCNNIKNPKHQVEKLLAWIYGKEEKERKR